jgi:divinyl protochlorophyllide a 8-vinyl-reductase
LSEHQQEAACHAGAAEVARIGPNAIIRVAESLEARFGSASEVFADAGLSQYLATPPTEMVDERDVIALQRALRLRLGLTEARGIICSPTASRGQRSGCCACCRRAPPAGCC